MRIDGFTVIALPGHTIASEDDNHVLVIKLKEPGRNFLLEPGMVEGAVVAALSGGPAAATHGLGEFWTLAADGD